MAQKKYLDLPGLSTYHDKILELLDERITPILYDTTANWDSQTQLESIQGVVYVYSDYDVDEDNNNVPGIKIGDGNAYLIDLPFTDSLFKQHIQDTVSHITAAERTAWNNKVRCYIDTLDDEKLIFTTN